MRPRYQRRLSLHEVPSARECQSQSITTTRSLASSRTPARKRSIPACPRWGARGSSTASSGAWSAPIAATKTVVRGSRSRIVATSCSSSPGSGSRSSTDRISRTEAGSSRYSSDCGSATSRAMAPNGAMETSARAPVRSSASTRNGGSRSALKLDITRMRSPPLASSMPRLRRSAASCAVRPESIIRTGPSRAARPWSPPAWV